MYQNVRGQAFIIYLHVKIQIRIEHFQIIEILGTHNWGIPLRPELPTNRHELINFRIRS